MEETVGHVEGGAAPALQREGVCQNFAGTLHALDDIAGTDAGGQQGLVSVPAGGVADQQLLLIQHPVGHGLGAFGVQQLLETVRTVAGDRREAGGIIQLLIPLLYHDVADVFKHLGGAVLTVLQVEQLRGLVDELGVALARKEGGVAENVQNERNVGLDATDVNFPDGAGRLVAHALESGVPGGDLQQQGVVIGRDLAAHAGRGRVQTDAEAAGGAVRGDLAGVRGKIVGGILGGDTALDGIAVLMHVRLTGDADAGIAEGIALGNQNLGTHQIDAGDHFRDGMLHLNPGVHLNEIVVALFIHQKFQRTGVDVADVFGDLHGVPVQRLPDLRSYGESGGEFHHLLVAALEGAVPFVEVNHVAVFIAQNLHFDVLRLHEELLHKDVVVAEGLLGLSLHHVEVGADFLHSVAAAHTASAAACGSLQDHREAELHSQLLGGLAAFQRLGGAGGGGNVTGQSDLLGGQLVAHHIQHAGAGADEFDAVFLAGTGKIAVFTEEAVAGVDGVRAVLLGQFNDPGDIQISAQRAEILADQVGLVRRRAEHTVGILVGIDGDGLQVQVMAGPEYAHGDLAAVCYQYFFEILAHVAVPPYSASAGGGRPVFGLDGQSAPSCFSILSIRLKSSRLQRFLVLFI